MSSVLFQPTLTGVWHTAGAGAGRPGWPRRNRGGSPGGGCPRLVWAEALQLQQVQHGVVNYRELVGWGGGVGPGPGCWASLLASQENCRELGQGSQLRMTCFAGKECFLSSLGFIKEGHI